MLQNFWNNLRTKNVRSLVQLKCARHIINSVHPWRGHASGGFKYNIKHCGKISQICLLVR